MGASVWQRAKNHGMAAGAEIGIKSDPFPLGLSYIWAVRRFLTMLSATLALAMAAAAASVPQTAPQAIQGPIPRGSAFQWWSKYSRRARPPTNFFWGWKRLYAATGD